MAEYKPSILGEKENNYVWRRLYLNQLPTSLRRFLEDPKKYSATQRFYDSARKEWLLVSTRWGTYRYKEDLSEIYRLEDRGINFYG